MVERVCPRCEAGNPSEQAFCGSCGAPLNQPLARRPTAALAHRPLQIPARWRQTGKVVALGVASVAAEAGLAWLQRRQQINPPRVPKRQSPDTARVVALGWRVSETWHGGQLQQRVEERVAWLMPDGPQR